MDRITQLAIERRLANGLVSLPQSTRKIIDRFYQNEISEIKTGKTSNDLNEDEFEKTMEAIENAIEDFRQGS